MHCSTWQSQQGPCLIFLPDPVCNALQPGNKIGRSAVSAPACTTASVWTYNFVDVLAVTSPLQQTSMCHMLVGYASSEFVQSIQYLQDHKTQHILLLLVAMQQLDLMPLATGNLLLVMHKAFLVLFAFCCCVSDLPCCCSCTGVGA